MSVGEKCEELHGLYTGTFLEIKEIVCKSVTLERLKAHIEDRYSDLKEDLQSAHTNDEVMKLFRKKKCNFPYFHQLRGLVCGLRLDEAVDEVNKFAINRQEIYKTIKAKDFVRFTSSYDHKSNVQVRNDVRY